MQRFYDEAARLRQVTGCVWEVDHIVPLKNPIVCGLHNEFNLRVIQRFDNRSKNNKFIAELAEAFE